MASDHIFILSMGHAHLGEVSIQVLCPFLIGFIFLVLSHTSSLYILEITLLSDVSLANMFSYTVSSPF